MIDRWRLAAAGLIIAALAFGSGFWIGGLAEQRIPNVTGSGYVGAETATLVADGVNYGLHASVAWRDASGAEHESGWPECLPHLQEVRGVRFAGTWLWFGGLGQAEVVWVDCEQP